ncbi:MAG: hypothetical protein ACFHU9_02320 [Fluviicola sp.]
MSSTVKFSDVYPSSAPASPHTKHAPAITVDYSSNADGDFSVTVRGLIFASNDIDTCTANWSQNDKVLTLLLCTKFNSTGGNKLVSFETSYTGNYGETAITEVSTFMANTGESDTGTGGNPAKTSRGTVVRVQSGSGGK